MNEMFNIKTTIRENNILDLSDPGEKNLRTRDSTSAI
jgi:hypothetical protein